MPARKKINLIAVVATCLLAISLFAWQYRGEMDDFANFSTVVNKYDGNPVLNLGIAGEPDNATLRDSCLLHVGNIYYLAYTAYSNPDASNEATICLAKSSNLINWEKMGIILSHGSGWESGYVCDPFLYYNSGDSTFYLFYSGGTAKSLGVPILPCDIGVAISNNITDIHSWTKYNGNPVISHGTQNQVNDNAVTSPSIIKTGNIFYAFYGCQSEENTRGISYATSTNLFNWTKNALNPMLEGIESIENPTVWYDKADAKYYMGVNHVTCSTEGIPVTTENLIYCSSNPSLWDVNNKRFLFGLSPSGWDSIICGSMAMDIDGNGRLRHILYDAGNQTSHFSRTIGLATVNWNYNNLIINGSGWTWITSSEGRAILVTPQPVTHASPFPYWAPFAAISIVLIGLYGIAKWKNRAIHRKN
jgi:hypothetical protein